MVEGSWCELGMGWAWVAQSYLAMDGYGRIGRIGRFYAKDKVSFGEDKQVLVRTCRFW